MNTQEKRLEAIEVISIRYPNTIKKNDLRVYMYLISTCKSDKFSFKNVKLQNILKIDKSTLSVSLRTLIGLNIIKELPDTELMDYEFNYNTDEWL